LLGEVTLDPVNFSSPNAGKVIEAIRIADTKIIAIILSFMIGSPIFD
jgi:hypothetical protein